MNGNCLVVLDLDGTSVRYEPRLEMEPGLMQYIASLRQDGVAWAMNSDRYTEAMIDIAAMLVPEQRPAAILSCQRFIHLLDGDEQYRPCSPWNNSQMLLHRDLWEKISPLFHQWQRLIDARFSVVDRVINDLVFAYMVPSDETPHLRRCIEELVSPWPDAQLSGNKEWTFILHEAFSKAGILKKCAELLGVNRQNIIAVGDGYNDITMLNGSVAAKVGCPADASSEVIDTVRRAGGFIAPGDNTAGTLQVLRHYLEQG